MAKKKNNSDMRSELNEGFQKSVQKGYRPSPKNANAGYQPRKPVDLSNVRLPTVKNTIDQGKSNEKDQPNNK